MKYEVICWASCTNTLFPNHSPVTACVELAVRKEIIAHGYCFGGDAHEDYCPVLSDGTLVSLSWRGWGGLMARARGENGDYDYMHYYMNALIDHAQLKYPPDEYPKPDRIVPRLTLAEKFEMHLRDDMFDAMARGTKRVEFRLFDEKRKAIDIGDYIEFHGKGGRLLKRVADLYADTDFKELFEQLTDRSYRDAFTAEDFGSPAGTDAAAFDKAMSAIYPPEAQKDGVLAFVLEDAVPLYSVTLTAWTDEWLDILEQYLSYEEVVDLPFFTDPDETGEKLQKIAHFPRCLGGFRRSAEGANFDETVGKVLKELFGKEDALKALAKQVGLAFVLDVTALFPDSPPVAPVLDAASEEFLRKINAHVHISPITLP